MLGSGLLGQPDMQAARRLFQASDDTKNLLKNFLELESPSSYTNDTRTTLREVWDQLNPAPVSRPSLLQYLAQSAQGIFRRNNNGYQEIGTRLTNSN